MSSLLDHLDSNQSENDDIHLLFPKCKPRASSVGTSESQSSESQSNSQQYLADNFRDQNLNHPSSGGGSTSTRQSSRRHSSSGFTHQQQQQQHHHNHAQQQQLPDNLLKHSKHSSYPPLLTATSPTISYNNTTGNNSYIGHGQLSPYDNNNLPYDSITNNKSDSRSSSHHHHHHNSSSRHHQHHHHLQQQQQQQQQQHHQPQSDSSDNFPLTPSFSSSSNFIGNSGGGFGGSNISSSKKGESTHQNHHHHHSSNIHHNSSGGSSIKSSHHHHSHSRSKNSISSRNSRHEAAAAAAAAAALVSSSSAGTAGPQATNSCQSQNSRHHSRSSHHHYGTSERSHHRSKRVTHMTESSSCEPISPATSGNKTLSSSSRYNKSQKSLADVGAGGGGGGGPTKSYSTLSLGSGMECEPLDDHHYDDGFCTTRSSRNLAASSNGASSYNSEHSSSARAANNIPGNGGCLRDSRIEIAGGREVYSQNRIRAGRRLRGSSSTSSSTEMMADSSMTASSSSSAGTKSRRKSPNIQPQLQQQQHQPQLVCTNGEDDGGSNGEHSVWEPKHSKGYQENTLVPTRSHHPNSHRHHGNQHHHHGSHHHQQQHHHHHQSHARNRHVCGYPHCDHTKVLSSADTSPACGGSYNKSNSGGPNMTHNSSSSGAGPMTVKETVFSTEITSIEKPIESENTGSKVMRPTPTSPATAIQQPPYIYETGVNEPRGEIIFDDIGNWGRNGGANRDASNNGGGSAAEGGGLCVDRSARKEGHLMKRSPSGGRRSSNSSGNAQGAQQHNIFHSDFMDENEGGMHCCGVEEMNHSGSSMNTSSAPTVLLQGSPSPSTRGGNTTPSGYESDEYSGVTPVSLNMIGCNNKGCLPNNRLIGQVPIAEYEGSPKRYGLRQPTHPMPTHLDLVDVDIPMDSGGSLRSPSGVSGVGGVGSAHHVVSLMSPGQPNKPMVPTTASSSSSSSLDNTNSNTSSTSSNRNLYSSRISPRVLSPSQSVSNFPSRVPGFPQRITPITSSLDSSSLVDSGLEKSEATDTIKSDSMLETSEGDMLVNNPCHHPDSANNDECPQQRLPYHQQQPPPPHQHHRHHPQQQISHHALTLQQKTHDNNIAHSLRSSEIDEPPSSTSLCQGQLVNSDHSSDLLLTDQLNIKVEKCTPSSTTNLCGNPLVDENHQMHHHLQQQQQYQHQQHHNMVLELVDSASLPEDHHQSVVQHHHQQSTIHSAAANTTGDESTKQHNASHSINNSDSIVDDQCLISVPSSSSDVQRANDNNSGSSTLADGNNLLGIGANSADYLYEFSETRKVLEEFFGSASVAGASGGVSAGAPTTIIGLDGNSMNQGPLFDELDYTLKRQAGNSYVGQRLAGESCTAVEESPKKPARRGVLLIGSSEGDGVDGGEAASPRLISFQEITLPQLQQQQQQQQKSAQNPPRDLNDNDIDGDTSSTNTETDNLGDTEVGLHVGLSRNFTLSPETTDCDSNELESEISLDYEASLHSSSRVGVSMPNVEDGLSSGNVSDTEETVPSSDQLSNDLKRAAQQQGLLCSSTTGSSSNPCNIGIANNSSVGLRQQISSSTGVSQHSSSRREHSQLQNPAAHHHHHHHHHLIEDGLGCNGTQQGAAAGVSLPSSSSSAPNNPTFAAQQLSLQTSLSSSTSQQQQQHPVSPSSSSSISTSKIPSDPNPTLLLMKKQISEIEKEIKMRASQQNQKMQLQQHQSLDTPTNSHNNSIMPVLTDEASSTSSNNNIAALNNGNSCVTSNGNGLVSQLNVSSCPDVSTLSNNAAGTPSNGAGGGQGACYAQQQLSSSSSSTGNNVNGPSHHSNADSSSLVSGNGLQHNSSCSEKGQETTNFDSIDIELEALDPMRPTPPPSPAPSSLCQPQTTGAASGCTSNTNRASSFSTNTGNATSGGSKIVSAAPINIPAVSGPPGSSSGSSNTRIPISESNTSVISPDSSSSSSSVAAAIQDIKEAIQRTKTLPRQQPSHVETSRPSPLTSSQSHADAHNSDTSPVWVPRQGTSSYHHHRSGGGVKDPLLRKQRYDETPDDDADTDQETDRLLGQTRTEDDYGFYDEKEWKKVKNCRSLLPALNKGVSFVKSAASGSVQPLGLSSSASSLNTGAGSNSSNAHGVPYSSSSNTIAPSSARISPAPFKQQQEPLPSSQLNSSSSNNANNISNKPKKEKDGIKKKRSKEDFKNPSVLIEGVLFRARYLGSTQLVCEGQPTKATRMMQAEEAVSRIKTQVDQSDLSSETEPLGTLNVSDSAEPTMHSTTTSTSIPTSVSTTNTTTTSSSSNNNDKGEQAQSHFEDYLYAEDDDSGDESCAESEFFHKGHHAIQSPTSSARSFQGPCFGGTSPGDPGTLPPSVHFGPACGTALPGTMFRLKFVGSLEVDEEVGSGKRRRKRPKKTMVEEAVLKMKAPEGETQPSTEVDLFISTEKIMVLNTDLKEIMMDHALRTISYIADIGDLVVLMARRRPVPSDTPDDSKIARPPKMICHVFESDEAQYIAQSIGQAFQVAYMEFLKANGIEDQSFVREMDYQEVLNSQEIFGDELQMFAKKELQKEVVVPKSKGEILGVVIVESGWGSMLPTVVIANLAPAGAAARCGQLNIGDQIIAINGVSLVGLPLSTCQNYIKNTKSQTVVKLTVVPCPPVVEVKIKRPDTKYQLGFSVQNGVICSLLRGGIAERGGVRVGHRIIEINGQSVVAVPHEKIVNLLATSVGEINMKTMPTSMFRLLTGQETPLYI